MKKNFPLLKIALSIASTCGVAVGSAPAIGHDGMDDVIAVGPVEAMASNGREFSVLGRAFQVEGRASLEIGQYVAVHGNLTSDGLATDVWVEVIGNYSPGSDPVYERGVVTEVRPFVGRMSIGGSQVDYTPALGASSGVNPTIGAVVEVAGTQPSPNGVVLVDGMMSAAAGVRDLLMKGGGIDAALMKGGGADASLMKGGGVEASLMKGGGLRSSLMKGGGLETSLMKGGGVDASLMKGGGLETSLMKGGGIQGSLMKGGGVNASLMKGGGLETSLMKGGGVDAALMKGGGVSGT